MFGIAAPEKAGPAHGPPVRFLRRTGSGGFARACAVGAFTVSNAELDTPPMLVFGVSGCVLKERDYPLAPLAAALVLGDRTEEAFRRPLLASQGDLNASIVASGRRARRRPGPGWLRSLLRPARRERPSPA
jgi:hypothetical protein